MDSHVAAARASLSLSMPYSGMSSSVATNIVVCEGWVLKKRRKKMQGFARRYFTLYQSGLLSYAFEPGQPVRDQISLHQAAISTAPGRKDIHLDSNTATFHIKCLSTDDFSQWMTAFRKFIVIGAELRKTNSIRLATRQAQQGTLKLVRTGVATGAILDEMANSISELESSIAVFKMDSPGKKHHSLGRHKSDKEKHRDSASVFGLFKKGGHHPTTPPSEFGADMGHENSASSDTLQASLRRMQNALDALKVQHASLLKLQQTIQVDSASSTHGTPVPLPATTEEDEHVPDDRFDVSSINLSKRMSIATSGTESLNEWFDASDGVNDGAQEFVLDVQTFGDGSEQPSRMLSNSSRSSLEHSERSSIDTDIAQDEPPARMPSEDIHPDPTESSLQVIRRTKLPAPPVGDEGSLFSILKKNVGKDLSTIAVPVTFNEPLTLLQRAAEEVEYYDLLTQAANSTDSVERMQFIAAFAVSSYAHTRHRSGRKGFNPMLAETFEDVRMKFIAEKVRHNPLEMAYHAEGQNWELWATSSGKTKFWGKSLEIIPLGTTHVKIGDDHFEWKKPSSFMRNLMVGTKYLEHCGKLIIDNTNDSSRCVLEFKQSGYWAAGNLVSGTVHAPNGDVVSSLEGKWDEQMAEAVDASHLRILWRASPWPKETHEYYGFTSYGVTLNEITDDLKGLLPPTDSRFRTDVRALEEGDMPLADEEKLRIEEIQRQRRRNEGDRKPLWFRQVGDEWVYAGGYWEARAKGWKDTKITSLW